MFAINHQPAGHKNVSQSNHWWFSTGGSLSFVIDLHAPVKKPPWPCPPLSASHFAPGLSQQGAPAHTRRHLIGRPLRALCTYTRCVALLRGATFVPPRHRMRLFTGLPALPFPGGWHRCWHGHFAGLQGAGRISGTSAGRASVHPVLRVQ